MLMDSLWQKYSKDPNNVIVGCVPVRPSPDDPSSKTVSPSSNEGVTAGVKSVVGTGGARQAQTDKPDDPRKPIEASELFGWGVAARIVNFVKNNANEARLTRASYIVTLEGRGFEGLCNGCLFARSPRPVRKSDVEMD